jgi:gluconokinase
MVVVLMGVSGSGKTTLGTLLAQRTGATFADADEYHSAANKAKMAAGTPLTDQDRQPWLETLNALLQSWIAAHKDGILACSALKQKYRETLTANLPDTAVQFVFLDGSKELIAQRLAKRHHEYMTGSLLDSQLGTLEQPKDAIRVVNDRTPDVVVDEILGKLKLRSTNGT